MGVVLRLPPGRGRAWRPDTATGQAEPGHRDPTAADLGTRDSHDTQADGTGSSGTDPSGTGSNGTDPSGSEASPRASLDPELVGTSPGGRGVARRWARGGLQTGGTHAANTDEAGERADWRWVEEWRAGGEPTPWATGLGLATFAALVVGVAVWVLAAGLSDRPVIAVLVNLLVAGGLAPAIWLSRGLPVLRWIGGGAAAGIVVGWLAAMLMLPLPAP